MSIYLPIAEISVNMLIILGIGATVGFLSGLFGVSGGFLMTPLLIFYNIPPAVAVATGLNQVIASSVSGALTHFKRRTLDIKLGLLLVLGGIIGSLVGIYIFSLLRELGQLDLIVSLLYVVLLSTVGGLMLVESWRTVQHVRRGQVANFKRPGQHNWIHRLPFKIRFRASKIYISIIPVLGIGFLIDVLAAIIGVGGNFIMVPALIYLLRVPTNVVIGTSLFQVTFVTAFTTIMQAMTNQSVDIVLAILLMIGGVIGVQYGARAGQKLRGEQLRLLLSLFVLASALRLACGLFIRPDNLFSITLATQ